MSESYRNHPSVLVKNILLLLIVCVFVSMSMGTFVWILVAVPFILLSVVSWLRTTMEVFDDHLVVTSKVFSVKIRNIQYDRVASVNAVSGLFGRIFGWSTVYININSSRNSGRPEVAFVFPEQKAAEIVAMIKGTAATPVEEVETVPEDDVPVFSFGFFDAVAFGIFGGGTFNLLSAVFWGLVSVVSFLSAGEAGIAGFLMFLITGLFPIVGSIIKHGNFRVYRKGDELRVVHGMITVYDTTFEIRKVNAVRTIRALIPRMFGMCCLQAEVVGINAEKSSTTPTLTLLIKESQLQTAMEALFPEFICQNEMARQPKGVMNLTIFRTLYLSIAVIASAAAVRLFLWDPIYEVLEAFALPLLVSIAAVLILLPVIYWLLAYRRFELGMGDRFLVSTTGVIDRSTVIIHYPKVQIVSSRASPRARKNGIARCTVSLLSAGGRKSIMCGFYETEKVDAISETSVRESGERLPSA